MKQPFFTGACTALVTPFLGGKVNYPMMEQLLRRQIDAGIEAVVICGTTGESATLSDCESWNCSAGQRHTSGTAVSSSPEPGQTAQNTRRR